VSVATPPAGGAGGHPIPTAAPQPTSDACPLCGAALDPEQEWCLRCGAAARTRLAASPSWKTPVIVLAAVVALSLGVLAAALVSLAGGSGHSTKAPVTVLVTATPTATIPPTTAVAPTTTAVPGTSTPTATPPSTTTAPGATTTSPSATTPGSTATTPGLTTPTSKSSPTTPKTTTTPSHATTGATPPASNPLVEESPKK
jgi:hypothetical protein